MNSPVSGSMGARASGTVEVDGETFRILGTGACTAEGVYCHLASTTRFTRQRNGAVPAQIATFIPAEQVEAALDRPAGFYSWSDSERRAFERQEQRAAGR